MTPQKQLNRHDPASGIFGDCYRTVIACLLDLPPEAVPHVLSEGVGNLEQQLAQMDAYLAQHGLAEVNVPFGGSEDLSRVLEVMAQWSGGVHYMLTGRGGLGCNHVVICKGAEIVWDPSQTNSGIVEPADDGHWWFSVLVKRT